MKPLRCRICGSPGFTTVLNLGVQALTGVFPHPGEHVEEFPIKAVRCAGECGLVQLECTATPELMYGMNYGYRSGLNHSMVKHLRQLASDMTWQNKLDEDGPGQKIILDIGANDGTSLGFYPEKTRRIAVDPTISKFAKYYKPGITMVPEFFTAPGIAKVIGDNKADVVSSIAMLYDLEDPQVFFHDVASILAPRGTWLSEQAYFPAVMKANAFDNICHEHLLFYSLKQIEYLATKANLVVTHVYETPTNGGSFVVQIKHKPAEPDQTVLAVREQERLMCLDDPMVYTAFNSRSHNACAAVVDFLNIAKMGKKTVYGLGASTKGNTLLQWTDANSVNPVNSLIKAIGDVNVDKHGCETPGTGIPIISEEAALAANADYYFVLPWAFHDFFVINPKLSGKVLVFPLPQLEIVRVP